MIYQFTSNFPVTTLPIPRTASEQHKIKIEKINNQVKLGTHLLLSGLLIKDVSGIQQEYLCDLRRSKKTNARSRNRSTIKLLLDFSHELWKYRSNILHDEATMTQEAVLRNQAVNLLRSLRTTPYCLPITKRKLLERSSDYLSTTPINNVGSWTNRVKSALEEQTHLEKTSSNDIRIWIHSGKIDSRENCMRMKTPDGWYDPSYYDSDDSDLTENEYMKYPDEENDSWMPNTSSTVKFFTQVFNSLIAPK